MNIFETSKKEEIIARINRLTPDSKALWGKMSVGEMLCHCSDGIKMAVGEMPISDKSNIFLRNIIKPLIIYVLPMPKDAPAPIEINPQKLGTKPFDFENDKQLLINEIERFRNLNVDEIKGKHHLFGNLTRNQWGRLGYKHIDHHLKQFGV